MLTCGNTSVRNILSNKNNGGTRKTMSKKHKHLALRDIIRLQFLSQFSFEYLNIDKNFIHSLDKYTLLIIILCYLLGWD